MTVALFMVIQTSILGQCSSGGPESVRGSLPNHRCPHTHSVAILAQACQRPCRVGPCRRHRRLVALFFVLNGQLVSTV